jgi:hypothetical protein
MRVILHRCLCCWTNYEFRAVALAGLGPPRVCCVGTRLTRPGPTARTAGPGREGGDPGEGRPAGQLQEQGLPRWPASRLGLPVGFGSPDYKNRNVVQRAFTHSRTGPDSRPEATSTHCPTAVAWSSAQSFCGSPREYGDTPYGCTAATRREPRSRAVRG